MKITFSNRESKIVAKVSNSTGLMTTSDPSITIRNQLREYQINSIQDLPDVDEVLVANGSTIVYNSNSGLYEIKHLTVNDVEGPIDEGEF